LVAVDDRCGDVGELATGVLGVVAQHRERRVAVDRVACHQDAPGLFDDGPSPEGSFQLVVFGEALQGDVDRALQFLGGGVARLLRRGRDRRARRRGALSRSPHRLLDVDLAGDHLVAEPGDDLCQQRKTVVPLVSDQDAEGLDCDLADRLVMRQTAKLVQAMIARPGVSYLRTTRAALPVLYAADEEFQTGGSRVVRSSDDDEVTLIAAGITLHEALAAAEQLAAEGVAARVIDLYSVKPIDAHTVRETGEATGAIVTVEDHTRRAGSATRCWRCSPRAASGRGSLGSPCA
jgi:hypothetical protein